MFTGDVFVDNLRQGLNVNNKKVDVMLIETKNRPYRVVRHLVFGLNPLIGLLKENNIQLSPLFTDAKIPIEQLPNPRYQLTPQQELRFTELALDALATPGIGLTLGQRYHLSSYGMLGLAAMTSSNLQEAFKIIFKYIQMTWTYMHFSLEQDDGLAIFSMEKNYDMGNCHRYMVDRDMVATYVFACEVLGEKLPLEYVSLTLNESENAAQYEQIFNCPVTFNQDTNKICFDKNYLQQPLAQSAIETSAVYEEQCQKVCSYLDVEGSFTERVRFQLIQTSEQISHLETLAQRMFTTRRNIQRKLAAEGTTFKELIEDIRKAQALEHLNQGDLSIEEIAEKLGYSDAASFSHAFKRWTGYPPGAKRR